MVDQSEPFTIDKLRAAAALVEVNTFRVNEMTNLSKMLGVIDAASYLMSDQFSFRGKTIHGVSVKKDARVPVDVIVLYRGDKVVKVIPLTTEATAAAEGYARAAWAAMKQKREMIC